MIREFETLFRRVATSLGLPTGKRLDVLRVGHKVDILIGDLSTATGKIDASLQGMARIVFSS